jgi:small subunit ribosomal protein S21
VQVVVRDNNVDQALRALKKKMQREGIFREMKLRNYYEKPSEKRAREKAEAIRRARKLARKKAQREGGVALGRQVQFGFAVHWPGLPCQSRFGYDASATCSA